MEKNLIAYNCLSANQLQERMTTTSQITLKCMSLSDDEITLIVGLFRFEESLTNKTNRLQRLLSNSSNSLEALMRTDKSNVAKHA